MTKKETIDYSQPYSTDINFRIRDLEEKQRLVKDRLILISQTLIDEREKTFSEIQKMKKTLITLEDENQTLKSFIKRLTEKVEKGARKEELMILQRQFDLFRDK